MPEEVVVLNIFSNEVDAGMAQQVLQAAGLDAFIFKGDSEGDNGGLQPRLPRTSGLRLVVSRADARDAHEILGTSILG